MATAASLADVRAWAREQGLQVGDRGRLPAAVIAQYDAAHAQPTKPPSSKPAARAARSRGPAAGMRKPAPSRPAAPAAQPDSQPDVQLAPTPHADPGSAELQQELAAVRSEVVDLRQQLDELRGRLARLEQPRGLFKRSKGTR